MPKPNRWFADGLQKMLFRQMPGIFGIPTMIARRHLVILVNYLFTGRAQYGALCREYDVDAWSFTIAGRQRMAS